MRFTVEVEAEMTDAVAAADEDFGERVFIALEHRNVTVLAISQNMEQRLLAVGLAMEAASARDAMVRAVEAFMQACDKAGIAGGADKAIPMFALTVQPYTVAVTSAAG